MNKTVLFPMFINSSKGGMQHVVLDLMVGLKLLGWECVLICYKGSEVSSLFKSKGINTRELQMPKSKIQWIKFIFLYYWIVYYYGKSLIVTNDIFSHILLSLYPFPKYEVFVSHGGDYKSKGKNFAANSGRAAQIAKVTFKRVQKFIAVSRAQKEALINNAKIDKTKICIIYNGFNDNINIERQNKLHREINISIVGYIKPLKNQYLLLQTIHDLHEKGYNCILNLYGSVADDAYYKKLMLEIERLRIVNSVVFHGYITDKNRIYNNTDILISCSYHEGFGLSLIEAMAYKVPTIAYAYSSGPSSIIVNNKTGILVEENTSEAYTIAILKYLTNKKFCNDVVKNAEEVFKQKFSLKNMIDKYNEFLTQQL